MAQDTLKKAFILGHPVRQSRSPKIHQFWLEELKLEGSYEAIDILPENLNTFLSSMKQNGFAGGNVTAPHKQETFRFVQQSGVLTSRALKIGAVNTLYFENDQIVGDNTDALGFIANLDQKLGENWRFDVATLLVIGAGGAARAVIAGLLENSGSRILISNRTRERAEALVAMEPERIDVVDWADIESAIAKSDLLVNTTTLGMEGKEGNFPFSLTKARNDALVTDLVYVPLETPFLRAAQSRGLRTVDGLGMLLHQAVPGFEHWFGKKPIVTEALRAVILDDLFKK